jgi:hypothetical protein
MCAASVRFDAATLLALVPAATLSAVPQVHALAARAGIAAETSVANCLVSTYARGGAAGALLARGVGFDVERYARERLHGFGANVQLSNALINFHARCGILSRAQQLFDEMPRRSVVSWTALITGYDMHGHGDVAVSIFEKIVHVCAPISVDVIENQRKSATLIREVGEPTFRFPSQSMQISCRCFRVYTLYSLSCWYCRMSTINMRS